MSYLMETLGRGLVGDLYHAVKQLLPATGDATLEELTAEVRTDKSDADAQLRLACALMEEPGNERIALAGDLFERILKVDPHSMACHVGLACVADRLGRNGAAEKHLADALALRSDDPILMFAHGMSLEKLDRVEEAQPQYEDVLRVCPALRNARERLAAILLLKGDLKSSAQHYHLLSAARPDHLGARLILASLHLSRGMNPQAVQEYELALTAEAENWNTEEDRVSQLEHQGRFEEALDQLQQSMEESSDNADTHVRMGDLLVKLGRDREALAEFLEAVETQPEFLEANVKTGTHFLRLGRYDQATAWFTRAVEINDRLLVGYVGLAVAQSEMGNRELSEETLRLAESIEPNSTLLFSEATRLGLKSCLQSKGSIRADVPDDADLESMAQLVNMTSSLTDLSDLLDSLIDGLRRVLSAHPNHAQLHYRLALLLRHRGRIEEANRSLEACLAINPNYVCARIKLGLGLRQVGEQEEAIEHFRLALGYDQVACRLHHKLALMFTQQPHFDILRQHYEFQTTNRTVQADASSNLQLALESMGLVGSNPLFIIDPDAGNCQPRLPVGRAHWGRSAGDLNEH